MNRNSLLTRLPGGNLYRSFTLSRQLRNTKYKLIYILFKHAYFRGGAYANRKTLPKMAEWLERTYLEENVWNFELFKLNPIGKGLEMLEIWDLIFPYLDGPYSSHMASEIGEGPYEMYGVQVEKKDVVIDAGANVGVFTLFASKCRGAYVHAFEPVQEIADVLCSNLKLNSVEENVKVNIKGLSDRVQNTTIVKPQNNLGGSSIIANCQKDDGEEETVELTTIDEYVKIAGLKKVDFIKADIEGAERYMLMGAKETMKRFKPKLAICTYHLPDDRKILTQIIYDANPNYKIKYTRRKLFAE